MEVKLFVDIFSAKLILEDPEVAASRAVATFLSDTIFSGEVYIRAGEPQGAYWVSEDALNFIVWFYLISLAP